MAGVLLVLGLIAAGIYTGSWGFYAAAGVMGAFYMLFVLVVTALAAVGASAAKKQIRRF